MIPIRQRIVNSGTPGDPNDIPGDCVKACVASILELPYEDVPHFVNGEVINPNLVDGVPHPDGPFKMDWYSGLRWWMKQRGYTVIPVHRSYFKDIHCQMAWRKERDAAGIDSNNARDLLWMYDARDEPPWHEGFWIASVISENIVGGTHAIVMEGSTVAFDPSPRPRRTSYQYVGEMTFVAPNAAVAHVKPQTERGWLIETDIRGFAQWWSGMTLQTDRSEWTSDPIEAIRFARKEDAERVILRLLIKPARATENIWI